MNDRRGTPPTLPGLVYKERLGSGGYSDVFLYEQQMPRMPVAVKVLHDEGLTDVSRQRFTDEANAMAALSAHPYIVQILNAGVASDGRPYLVMQLYPRANLSVRARQEPLPVAEVLRIGVQMCSAVETAHRAGILHRDIKPANILTSKFGDPGLTDFGIAATTAESHAQGPEGMSIPWSPPEVFDSELAADERSDVYSLAATLYTLLTGRSPFEVLGGDNSPLALMTRITRNPVPSLARDDAPESLERLLRQAMSKDPGARPASALALAHSLRSVEQDLGLKLTAIVIPDESPAERTDDDGDGATRVRMPKRIPAQEPISAPPADPRPPVTSVPSAQAAELITGTVRRDDVLRPRVGMLQEPPVENTVVRQGQSAVTGAQTPKSTARRPTVYAAAGAAVVVLVVLGVVAFSAGGGHGTAKHPGTATTTAVGPTFDPLAGAAPPMPTDVTVSRSGDAVVVSWHDAAPRAGDFFQVQRTDDSGQSLPPQQSTATSVTLTAVAASDRPCVSVRLVRKDGAQSDPSTPVCVS